MPPRSSLIIVITANILLQMSFFVIVSSSSEYAQHLGGTPTFSGVVIGIPTLFSGLALIPMLRYDGGGYNLPLHVCCGASIVGHVLYACAYRANFLYLILIGRMVSGLAFTFWMYCKRYCSDARIVGIRRRTTLASFLVMGQGFGMSLGPFLGGVLYKIGFKNRVFNGFTSPGWLMAGVWAIFWMCVTLWYEDVPKEQAPLPPPAVQENSAEKTSEKDAANEVTVTRAQQDQESLSSSFFAMSWAQWGVVACMCWFAMTCFFILGAWESNLPVFGADSSDLNWSPFAAGNFIALGGIAAFPFLLLNMYMAGRAQDRHILAFGSFLGLAALLTFLALLRSDKLTYPGVFMCWWAVALGFNLASTAPVSLLSKQLPPSWNGRTSLIIQYSYYTGRVTGAIWGGSGVKIGMMNYVGLEIAFVGVGALLFMGLWRDLKAKTG
ncbi:major facilitator superfamily domain-containing protein [Ephemerocybe angulata]|uniref:Major facilitator superfamily domain-containing protein n=1 Tax=Ephemerocybe angulata TaxID=980116 RepID=A0A8H6HTQ6_9AGAR|nr:major facilitator superfamily domain-containing protein [Tulosesus angulatus]